MKKNEDYTFKLSDKVTREKVTFKNRYGITLAGDLYLPKNAKAKHWLHLQSVDLLVQLKNNHLVSMHKTWPNVALPHLPLTLPIRVKVVANLVTSHPLISTQKTSVQRSTTWVFKRTLTETGSASLASVVGRDGIKCSCG